MHIPPAAASLFARHNGCASISGLLALEGVTRHTVVRWREGKIVKPVHHGVVRVAGAPVTPELRLSAALLRCGPTARAGPRMTCYLLKLEGFSKPTLDVVLPAPHRARSTAFPALTRQLEREDRFSAGGFPVLSAVRAIIEVAATLEQKELRLLIDSARRRRLTIDALQDRATTLREVPGSRRGARAVLSLLGSGTMAQESESEREMVEFLETTDLVLDWQVEDIVPGRRMDAADRAALLVIEMDSTMWHTLGSDRDADGLRDLELVEESDYIAFRLTLGMVRLEPDRTRAHLNAIRAKRTASTAAAPHEEQQKAP